MGIGGFVLFMVIFFVVISIPVIIHESCKSPEQKRQEQERFAKNREALKQAWEQDRMARKIVDVVPIGVVGKQQKRGGVKGALFGGFIGGIPGAAMGTMFRIGPSVPVFRFMVKYGNGERSVRDCMQGSSEYKYLMQWVKPQD
jgi:hypothetical protein